MPDDGAVGPVRQNGAGRPAGTARHPGVRGPPGDDPELPHEGIGLMLHPPTLRAPTPPHGRRSVRAGAPCGPRPDRNGPHVGRQPRTNREEA
ncbi:hypothetical protein GCM10010274_45810 [Streptomyces lavendofoliae]|uniref:Uncharacterized protein n=1 Tax=Streptomyces lavendofoliae TaxID=67314 RepID=A0A918M6K6_9ACTN|nr:hypothetical protein GCM10010274_45810 [Streptomyces lavendofoliae]